MRFITGIPAGLQIRQRDKAGGIGFISANNFSCFVLDCDGDSCNGNTILRHLADLQSGQRTVFQFKNGRLTPLQFYFFRCIIELESCWGFQFFTDEPAGLYVGDSNISSATCHKIPYKAAVHARNTDFRPGQWGAICADFFDDQRRGRCVFHSKRSCFPRLQQNFPWFIIKQVAIRA